MAGIAQTLWYQLLAKMAGRRELTFSVSTRVALTIHGTLEMSVDEGLFTMPRSPARGGPLFSKDGHTKSS
jgi:hypothetical protein